MASILLIDDDASILRSVGGYLEHVGHDVERAPDGESGLQLYERTGADIVLLDLMLPDISGMEVLERLRARNATVILLTGHGDVDVAVRAMQLGAENFLTKPVEMAHLSALVAKAADKVRLLREVEHLKSRYAPNVTSADLGVSPKMRDLAKQVGLVAASEHTTVLLTGESGTGKGLVARTIHALSSRATMPFIDINCGGLDATLLEAELFGHEQGASTETGEMKRGLFEIADGGTLFLDEIGDLAAPTQPKLLRVLESRTVRRLGAADERTVDVRLIAATNRDLQSAVAAGTFRENLFCHLTVASIHLPPLRERTREDRLDLLKRLLAILARDMPGVSTAMSSDALEKLLEYPWPGNVREIRNALERTLIMARGGPIGIEHLPTEIRRGAAPARRVRQALSLEQVERQHIERTLKHHAGNRTRTARELGISRPTLLKKIKRYGLGGEDAPDRDQPDSSPQQS